MATQEPVEVPTETLERIEAFLKEPDIGVRRGRPQRQLEQDVDLESDDLDPETDEEIDPIIVMLKKERLARGWTQWDVAKRMGLTSQGHISLLEAGKVDLQLSTLRHWAEVLDVEVMGRAKRKRRGRPQVDFR